MSMARRRQRTSLSASTRELDRSIPGRHWLLPGLLLTAAAVAAYANSFTIPFVWDDFTAIVDNPTIRRLSPLWVPLLPPLETPMAGRPIPNLSLALNYALGGLDVRGYHGLNLAIHVCCGWLLFAIFWLLFAGSFGVAFIYLAFD